jgi:hypothetical protein
MSDFRGNSLVVWYLEAPRNPRLVGRVKLEASNRRCLLELDDGWRRSGFPCVHALELAAVDGCQRTREKSDLTADDDELRAGRADRRTIVAPEVGDGFEVRRQPPGQPHELDIAAAFSLQPPARLEAIEIAVNVELQQRCRMIAWPTGRGRHGRKTERAEIQRLHESFNQPRQIVRIDIVFQTSWKKRGLHTILALNEARHDNLPVEVARCHDLTFSHSLRRKHQSRDWPATEKY